MSFCISTVPAQTACEASQRKVVNTCSSKKTRMGCFHQRIFSFLECEVLLMYPNPGNLLKLSWHISVIPLHTLLSSWPRNLLMPPSSVRAGMLAIAWIFFGSGLCPSPKSMYSANFIIPSLLVDKLFTIPLHVFCSALLQSFHPTFPVH